MSWKKYIKKPQVGFEPASTTFCKRIFHLFSTIRKQLLLPAWHNNSRHSLPIFNSNVMKKNKIKKLSPRWDSNPRRSLDTKDKFFIYCCVNKVCFPHLVLLELLAQQLSPDLVVMSLITFANSFHLPDNSSIKPLSNKSSLLKHY